MENEFEYGNDKGYSRLPQNPEFIDDMKKYLGKTAKYALISAPVIYALILIITAVVTSVKGNFEANEFFLLAIVLFAVFAFIALCVVISYFRNISKLKCESVDGTVVKSKKWTVESQKKSTSRTRYLIVIKTDDGKKIKVKDSKAMAVYPHIAEGDKVRFHPGYPFPVEVYDKSRNGVNICAFCGMANDLSAKNCTRCKNMMLL